MSPVVPSLMSHPSWAGLPSRFTIYSQPHVSEDQFPNKLLELQSLSRCLLHSHPKPREYPVMTLHGVVRVKTMSNPGYVLPNSFHYLYLSFISYERQALNPPPSPPELQLILLLKHNFCLIPSSFFTSSGFSQGRASGLLPGLFRQTKELL